MSVWDYNKYFDQQFEGGSKKAGIWKYTKWANPFKNSVKSIEILACEGELLAYVEMTGIGFGDWFWTQFIPSPVELARKTVVGSYRCGFYLGIKFKSPLDIIWRDGSASRFLARIARPFTTAVYYFWGVQTLWEFLSTWQSLIYAGYICDADQNTCIAGSVISPITAEGSGEGVVAAGLDIYDPNGWHEGLSGNIEVPAGAFSSASIFLEIVSLGYSADSLRFELSLATGDSQTARATWEEPISPNTTQSVALLSTGTAGALDHWRCRVWWTGGQRQTPLSRINITCIRMVVKSSPDPLPNPCPPWTPGLLS